ncbi:hypothetical protein EIP86_010916 [Pleurotus ostreatoroseus]|nr:hypothetical protein EIP86_010916 [Pleurotus ostreatoroseus]
MRHLPPLPSCHASISLRTVRTVSGADPLDNHLVLSTQEIDSTAMVDAGGTLQSSPSAIGQYNARGIPHPIRPHQTRSSASSSRPSASLSHLAQWQSSPAQSRAKPSRRMRAGVTPPLAMAACLFGLAPAVSASPIGLVKRDGGSSHIVPIIVPVVVVGVLIVIAILVLVIRKGWHRRMRHWGETAAANFGPNPGVTELTAQQLAGPDAPVLRTRRTRRNRRTPSQISSRSLPAYMKEPGEHEVVIYRGPDDMEDAPTTNIVVPMPSVTEATETPDLSVSIDASISVSRIYVPMPDSPHDMPLLAREDSRSTGEVEPPAGLSAAVSTDDSRSALLQGRSPDPSATPDPRGAAPPYFEVVAMDRLDVPSNPDIEASPNLSLDEPPTPDPSADVEAAAPSTGSDNANTHAGGNPLRSRFLGLFHARHGSTRGAPPADSPTPSGETTSSGHSRGDSNTSSLGPALSSNRHSRMRSGSTRTHRPSFSGSGSLFSVVTRSRSHLLDSPNPGAALTSPSMISLNSISAPIAHTLVRTEFTYPRAGPTPEQIALISSREGLVRFGMPYGDEAIAFHHAASSSRMDLPNFAPPDFEEATGRSRATSNADQSLEEPTPRRNNTDLPSGDETGSDESGSEEGVVSGVSPQAAQNATASTTGPANAPTTMNAPDVSSSSAAAAASASASAAAAHSETAPVASSSAQTTNNTEIVDYTSTSGNPAKPTIPSAQVEPTSAPNELIQPPIKPSLVPSPLSQSSFPRTESRASSRTNATFATAEESLHSATSPTTPRTIIVPLTEEPETLSHMHAGSQEPTPRIVPLEIEPESHIHDNTNATTPITPTAATPTTEIGHAL